jgi:hypothetical protein
MAIKWIRKVAEADFSAPTPKGLIAMCLGEPPIGWEAVSDEEQIAYAALRLDEEDDTEMITPEQIRAACEDLLAADEAQFSAEEDRIGAANARDKKFMEAINDAQADGITDPGRQQQKAMKATREELTALHLAEKASRLAQHNYRQAGIKVDSLNKQVEAGKLAAQNENR